MKRCRAKMRTYGGWSSKADLGQRCPDAATDGAYCWVHAQQFKREQLPPMRPASRPSIADRWARLDALAWRGGVMTPAQTIEAVALVAICCLFVFLAVSPIK